MKVHCLIFNPLKLVLIAENLQIEIIKLRKESSESL